MRNLKFRGRDIETKEWIYGGIDSINECISLSIGRERYIAVDSKTIGQYTTMNDNNNKEIYEGDIVEFLDSQQEHCMSYEHEDFFNKGIVVWNDEKLGFDVSNRIDVDEYDVWHDIKVIGNIFENERLLEEE